MLTVMDRAGGEEGALRLARLELLVELFRIALPALEEHSKRLADKNAELVMEIQTKESERADLKLQFDTLTATTNALQCKNKELEEQVLKMDTLVWEANEEVQEKKSDNAKLQSKIGGLTAENKNLEEKIAELKEDIETIRRDLDG